MLIWVHGRFLIISVLSFHCPEPLYHSCLLSEVTDTLQSLRFPCESRDSAWHQTWEASCSSMKGKRSRLDHPRQIKQPFHVWSAHSLKTNPSVCCLWTSLQLQWVPYLLCGWQRENERTPYYFIKIFRHHFFTFLHLKLNERNECAT